MFDEGETDQELLLPSVLSQLPLAVVKNRILGFDLWSDALQPFLSPLGILEIRIFYQNIYRRVYSFHLYNFLP